MKKKIKPLLPSLRERKRYLAFEVISESPIKGFSAVSKAIWDTATSYLGELGCSKAGIMVLEDKYNEKIQRGLIRVSHKSLDKLRATLAMITMADNQEVIVRSVGASGMIGKAEKEYIAG